MALVRVQWTETTTFEAEFEIDGYLPNVHVAEQVEDQVDELSSEAMDKAELVTTREFNDGAVQIIREGDLTPEVKHAKKHEDMF